MEETLLEFSIMPTLRVFLINIASNTQLPILKANAQKKTYAKIVLSQHQIKAKLIVKQ